MFIIWPRIPWGPAMRHGGHVDVSSEVPPNTGEKRKGGDVLNGGYFWMYSLKDSHNPDTNIGTGFGISV